MTNKPSYLYWPTLLTVITFFTVSLLVSKLVYLCFHLLILISIITFLVQRDARANFWSICKTYWAINLAMFGTLCALLINQLSTGSFDIYLYDLPSRLALFVVIFWTLLQVPLQKLKLIKWSWIAGVVLCTIQLFCMGKDVTGRPTMLVWYIELVMLLGIFSALSIGWNEPKNKLTIGIQIIAGACGLYSAYISQTRGIWLAIPVFTLLMFATLIKNWCSKRNFLFFGAIILVIGVAFCTTDIASKRIEDAKQDISLYSKQENPDTSIGVRFQIWQGAWIIFKEHPIFGVGRAHYSDAMHGLEERKIITPTAATFFHCHNEILYNMMTLGIFGLAGILLIYLVPAYYFARELRHSDRQIRASAAMGLSLCFGFMIFGLVDVMFMYKATDVFYSFAAAIFLAHIVKRKAELSLKSGLES
ncbi:O-antigen ligase family protein [Solimicrobium silvestre]|uniref:O-antigen ligase like membrane protein n=1 Tax=Solimicrobium silvestre TaxID=2099400 RepID=A0A2S9GYL2_9BURK|nr:O-antigen ligase family protein [Solimicrobium silvestre]PRC92815.1 O-antigen ligase like membrane protein [Solimicrobium silvestre]